MEKSFICDGNKCDPRPANCYCNSNTSSPCWHTTSISHALSKNYNDFPPTKTVLPIDNGRTISLVSMEYEIVDEEATLAGLERGDRYKVPESLLSIDKNLSSMLKNWE